MLSLTAAGNTARHEFTPEAGEKKARLSFSLAVSKGKGPDGQDRTQWISCALYGLRAEKLWPFFEGVTSMKLTVMGEPWVSGKDRDGEIQSYLNMVVRELTFQGGKQEAAKPANDDVPF
jgi:hypothetical protein